MCGNPFKTPKSPGPAAPPAPPAPPAPEPPSAPALSEEAARVQNDRGQSRLRRIGRSALRIDLQGPPTSGHGLQAPRS